MLSHLSSKFAAPSPSQDHEPRAALFLNRYTRTLTIMYATNGLSSLLGMTGEEMKGKSFYYCIQENCLQDAIRCLENAKSNDSIAYLRFWFRDPRQDTSFDERELQTGPIHSSQHRANGPLNTSSGMTTNSMVLDPQHAGVPVQITPGTPDRRAAAGSRPVPALEQRSPSSADSRAVSSGSSIEPVDNSGQNLRAPIQDAGSRGSSGDSNPYTHEAVFGEEQPYGSSVSSISASSEGRHEPIELEAVVSCTSDGLVVCLRRAKAGTPLSALQAPQPDYANGLFAVPWASNPILPPVPRAEYPSATPTVPAAQASHESAPRDSGPPTGLDFMSSIRDIAIFAWALVGINGSLAEYSSGRPRGESQPASGLPIWQPDPARERAMVHTNSAQGMSNGSVTLQNSWNAPGNANMPFGAYTSEANGFSLNGEPGQFNHPPNGQTVSWATTKSAGYQNPSFGHSFPRP